jgi:hypothetical protein
VRDIGSWFPGIIGDECALSEGLARGLPQRRACRGRRLQSRSQGSSGTFGGAPREPIKDRKDETARADLSDGRRTDGPERGGGISGSDDAEAGVPPIDGHHL